ncbi:hypothetical protein [Candidatus Phaeomarinobacter ectocarpi]|uniref:hypothetical protein n=1 Tax=Candidatus Phaeomarinibacter ectocarpi TaxID=1458461 RepID=UPI000698D280|nr:hypothetical protein [Candidatus Phaeomarinobacter ectocarpi]
MATDTKLRTRWKTIGFGLSAGYAAVFVLLVVVRWDDASGLELNELGDFLAGLFAPLALLWLVLGFFQQGEELRLQAKELHESVKHAGEQAASLSASEKYTKEEIRWHVHNNYLNTASTHASDLYFYIFWQDRTQAYPWSDGKRLIDFQLSRIWERFEQGDREHVMAQLLEELHRNPNWWDRERVWVAGMDSISLQSRIRAFSSVVRQAWSTLGELEAPAPMMRVFESGYGAQLVWALASGVEAYEAANTDGKNEDG